MGQNLLQRYFPAIQEGDKFYAEVTDEAGAGRRVVHQLLIVIVLSFVYGAVMGSYHSALQAVAAGIKLPLLFLAAIVICFPALYIIQSILGSKLGLLPMASVILSGFVLATAVMVSFIPIIVIFLLTGGNYHFLQLLHIAIVGLSGLFGMKIVVDALRYSCEQRHVYPQAGVVVFRIWIVIVAFVGIQLAWNLRPFLNDPSEPFKVVRHYEGNFYAAIVYSFGKLVEGDTLTIPRVTIDSRPANARPDTSSTWFDVEDSLFAD